MMSVSYTMFNRYFVKKRIMMMSLAQGLIGIGSMLMPIMIERVMQYYGFRGCLAILAALNGHALLGMMVMHPVEWHMKKVEIPDDEICKYIYTYRKSHILVKSLKNISVELTGKLLSSRSFQISVGQFTNLATI